MNGKKGLTILEFLVRLVPVIVLLVLFIGVMYKLLSPIIGQSTGEVQNENSMSSLGSVIDNMLSKESTFETQRITLTLRQGTYIRGFDDETKMEDCDGKPCLCLYQDAEAVKNNKALSCRQFNLGKYNKMRILSMPFSSNLASVTGRTDIKQFDGAIYPQSQNKYTYGLFILNAPFEKAQALYLEKYVANGIANVVVSRVAAENDPCQGRECISQSDMDARMRLFGVCPEISVSECRGKPVGFVSGNNFCKVISEGNSLRCELAAKVSEVCREDVKTDKPCLCNGIEMTAGNYCHKKGSEYYRLTFSCEDIKSCADYCNAESSDGDCGNNRNNAEMYSCSGDACSVSKTGCKLGTKTKVQPMGDMASYTYEIYVCLTN